MQRKKFFSLVALILKAGVETASNLRLPSRIILFRTPAEVLRQLQAIFDGKKVHGSFKFSHTHIVTYDLAMDEFKKDFDPTNTSPTWLRQPRAVIASR